MLPSNVRGSGAKPAAPAPAKGKDDLDEILVQLKSGIQVM